MIYDIAVNLQRTMEQKGATKKIQALMRNPTKRWQSLDQAANDIDPTFVQKIERIESNGQ